MDIIETNAAVGELVDAINYHVKSIIKKRENELVETLKRALDERIERIERMLATCAASAKIVAVKSKDQILEFGAFTNEHSERIFFVPGHERDDQDSLERDGLIKVERGDGMVNVTYEPDNQRVLAWCLTMNGICARGGRPLFFPDVADDYTVIGTA